MTGDLRATAATIRAEHERMEFCCWCSADESCPMLALCDEVDRLRVEVSSACQSCGGVAVDCARANVKCCPECAGLMHHRTVARLRAEARAADLRARIAAVETAVTRWACEPGCDEPSCPHSPEPEDGWRLVRDIKAALAGGEQANEPTAAPCTCTRRPATVLELTPGCPEHDRPSDHIWDTPSGLHHPCCGCPECRSGYGGPAAASSPTAAPPCRPPFCEDCREGHGLPGDRTCAAAPGQPTATAADDYRLRLMRSGWAAEDIDLPAGAAQPGTSGARHEYVAPPEAMCAADGCETCGLPESHVVHNLPPDSGQRRHGHEYVPTAPQFDADRCSHGWHPGIRRGLDWPCGLPREHEIHRPAGEGGQ